MTNIVTLSVELVLEIVSHLDSNDYSAVRATCTTLASAVDSAFFETLIVPTNRLNVDLLAAVAQHGSPWSTRSRTLLVAPGRSTKKLKGATEQADVATEDHWQLGGATALVRALTQLANVSVVRYKICAEDPEWLIGAVFAAFQHLPFHELELKIESGQLALLPPLSNTSLRTLKVHAPVWYRPIPHLYGAPPVPEGPAAPSLGYQVAAIVGQNPGLQKLHLFNGKHWDEVWNALLRSSIRLRSLSTNKLNALAMGYLGGYSGLERLTAEDHDAGSTSANDREAAIFFGKVLPKHAATLRELRCASEYESRWCFGRHNETALRHLTALRILEMSVHSEELRSESSETPIPLLFELATSLPSLTNFGILCSDGESTRGARCGNPRRGHREWTFATVQRAIPPDLNRIGIREDTDAYRRGASSWDVAVKQGPKWLRASPKYPYDLESTVFLAYRRMLWAGEVLR